MPCARHTLVFSGWFGHLAAHTEHFLFGKHFAKFLNRFCFCFFLAVWVWGRKGKRGGDTTINSTVLFLKTHLSPGSEDCIPNATDSVSQGTNL